MKSTFCSLCRKEKKTTPLDTRSMVFGSYIKAMRFLKFSKHIGEPGVCKGCMNKYKSMLSEYRKKQVIYGLLAVFFAAVYMWATGNIVLSLVIAVFVFSLSFFSYVPPLKAEE